MKKVKGKIILVDDDSYEEDFIEKALKAKNYEIKIEYLSNVDDALEHLKLNADEVFLIISDINMPGKNGLDFKQILEDDEYLSKKSIPFVFISNSLSKKTIVKAYDIHVQGFFEKPNSPEEQAEMFEIIVQYWIRCIHPNKNDLPDNPNTDD